MSELKFKRDTTFRKQFFVPDSFAHPAKLDAQLCIWITEYYTKPGDTIADFMAGSGTQMLACTMGRNVILGELESKYIRLCIHNWEIVKMHPQLGCSLGDCLILWGDSRNLESLRLHPYRQLWLQYPKLDIPSVKSVRRKFNLTLAEQIKLGDLVVDKIVSSPPYSDSPIGGGLNIKPPRPGHNDQTGRKPSSPSQLGAGKYADAIVTSPPYANPATGENKTAEETRALRKTQGGGLGQSLRQPEGYGSSPSNIGNLNGNPRSTTEEIDDKYDLRRPKTANWGREAYRGRYGDAEGQIGKLDYGEIDTVISSSPYEGSVSVPNSRQDARAERLRKAGYDPKKYQGGPGRNLQQDWNYHPVDAVITSPPYEEAHDKKIGGLADKDRPDLVPYSWVKTDNPQNIGNLKEESYLQAMLLVYRQCYKILRPKGLMILIVKPFIREKKVIPLQEDTKSLCEKAGFSFVEEHYRILPSQSFWRILYHKKFPGVPLIDKEYVLVFKK